MQLTHTELLKWLKTDDQQELEQLWQLADQTRRANVGDEVHLRGLIEISNICCRSCAYCGLNVSNKNVERYSMSTKDVMECVAKANSFGYGTVVLQSGENYNITKEWIVDIIHQIKKTTNLAITLSLGERSNKELAAWKNAGADRYLLRFETSDNKLYNIIHPSLPNTQPNCNRNRISILHELKALGYEVGSGVMIGIPGQSYATLARDILLFGELDLDMVGVGPFLPHPETMLGNEQMLADLKIEDQVPNTELMTYKVVALTRLVCPKANIPSTTALATINQEQGRELGLMRGANVIMPNTTQLQYRQKYVIYPNKSCITEEPDDYNKIVQAQISCIGRIIGKGKGGRIK